MTLFNHRIGRTGFLICYLPVIAAVVALIASSGEHKWRPHGASEIALLLVLAFWTMLVSAWRCHDYGKSAWSNFLTEQVPVIGPLFGFWDLVTTPGTPGPNAYGPKPRF